MLAAQQAAHKDDTVAVLDRETAFLGRFVRDPGGLAGRAVELIAATESDDVVAIIDALAGIATTP